MRPKRLIFWQSRHARWLWSQIANVFASILVHILAFTKRAIYERWVHILTQMFSVAVEVIKARH